MRVDCEGGLWGWTVKVDCEVPGRSTHTHTLSRTITHTLLTHPSPLSPPLALVTNLVGSTDIVVNIDCWKQKQAAPHLHALISLVVQEY